MLSKEEYLDNLLKGISEQENEQKEERKLSEEEAASELTMEEGAEPELIMEEGAEPELTMEEGAASELTAEEEAELGPSVKEEPEAELGLSVEPEPELPGEPEFDADLDALLEAASKLTAEEEAEPELTEEEGAEPELIMDEGAEPELTEEEGAEPELIMDEGAASELTAEEEAELGLSVEPELDAESDVPLDLNLDDVLENLSDPVMEEGAISEPPAEEPDPELSTGLDLDADLDALLKSVPDMDVEEDTEPAGERDSLSDIGEDIEARLDMAAELPPVTEEFPEDDVMSMLEESDDSDLQEIQELLRKSDSNEAVDDSVEDLLREQPEEDLETKVLGDSEEAAEETPAERRRKAKEKKAREKAEKKAEAEARKAAKKAEKEASKRKKSGAGNAQTHSRGEEQEFDPSILDSIVSEAGMAGSLRKEEGLPAGSLDDVTAGGEEEEPFNPLAEADERSESPQPETAAEDSDGLDMDLDNLFGSDETGLGDGIIGLSGLTEEQGADVDREKGEKKKGLFSRILDFLTEEDEEEEENENIKLSQENQDILNELDKEKGKKKKGKKGKKDKDEDGSEKDAKGKKAAKPKAAKPKKAPKPKKQKPPKEAPLIPERKLTFKKMLPVILVGVSIGVLLFVFVNATVDFTDKKTARDAFYAGDYQTCYQNLFGKELDETESIMFGKSKSILYIRLWIREYQMFAEEGDRVRGLDSLIQTVAAYPGLYEYAQQWNAEEEVAAGYAAILNLLKSDYGLSESQALEISNLWRDVDYTRAVIAAAEGSYGSAAPGGDDPGQGNDQGGLDNSGEGQLPDFLPEEEGLGEENFHDNR